MGVCVCCTTWPWNNCLHCGETGSNEMQIRERNREENDGLHCHRYALKLTCQTLKVCTLTHASLNIAPTMQCAGPLPEN